MIYVILGMHKSGTTLLSRILHYSGINMGEFDAQISYDDGNQYERESVLRLNEAVLGLTSYRIIDFTAPDHLTITDEQRQRMQTIIANGQASYAEWGFKDPRTCLTYPLWRDELPEHKLILVYRDPREIWQRFRYRHWKANHRNPRQAWWTIYRWCEHNARSLDFLRATDYPYLVLNYRQLMVDDSTFKRLETFVGQPLNDQRRPNLYRHQPQRSVLFDAMAWLIKQRVGYDVVEIERQLDELAY